MSAVAAEPLSGQHVGDREDRILRSEDSALPDYNVSAARRAAGFRLFANRDAAGTGMRLTGNFSFATDNYGPCDAPLKGFCNWVVHPSRNPLASVFQFFEVIYLAGAPPSEWAKIRRVAPALANARGNGWTTLMNFALFADRWEWGPRDGTLGALFSGVTSTSDGTCRDNASFGNGFFRSGLPLLASSDCPVTWGAPGWRGDRPIPVVAWEAMAAERRGAFRFDYWRVPDSLRTDGFLGSRFHTYGESSDHYQEILAEYGAAVPGGTGPPKFEGYPLGLVWRFEAFTFAEPGLESVVFWRGTVINRSADVYGTGVDYDSLYLGFSKGTGTGSAGGGSRYSNYYLPDQSLVLFHQSDLQGSAGNPSPPCRDAWRLPAGALGCGIGPWPYANGGNAIIILKSPIGDLRNKLFTRRLDGSPCMAGADPFCTPGHPARGDTITFNHGHMCHFGGCWSGTHNVNDRRSFGLLSSTEANVIDGQTLSPGSFAFRTFRNIGYPAVMGRFNKYVPGVQGPPAAEWDWNHDGLADPLFFDSCGPAGCVAMSWDTLPGGHVNAGANVGGVIAAGPVQLAAGDSTSWFTAFVGESDSARTWGAIHAAIEHYLTFFPRPEPVPPPAITAAQAASTNEPGRPAAPSVSLFFDATAERWTDPFLLGIADGLQAAAPNSSRARLLALNPWLVDSLRARAGAPLEAIEIYKSCDGGRTFTADPDCLGDPSLDPQGRPLGTGWQAYTRFEAPRAGGDFPNAFTDSLVEPGREYLYAFVTVSRGAEFTVQDDGGPRLDRFAPSLRSALVTQGPRAEVARVYVPASREAGSRPAQVAFTARPREVTVPFELRLTDSVRAGHYRAVFGNTLRMERDSLRSTGEVVRTTVTVERVERVAPSGALQAVMAEAAIRPGPVPVPATGLPASTFLTTIGDTSRAITTYGALGFLVTDADGRPVFLSTNLSGVGATPDRLFGSAVDPGFLLSVDNTLARRYDAAGEPPVRSTGDTVPAGTSARLVQWREQESSPTLQGVGRYVVTWLSEPFGLPQGLGLDPARPGAAEAEVTAALRARDAGPPALMGQEVFALTGVPVSDQVPGRMPFTVRNETFGRDVLVVMPKRQDSTLLLGGGADTVRVRIPEDEWIPGDELIFLEDIVEDSVDLGGNLVLDPVGLPIPVVRRRVTFTGAVLGCEGPRPPRCNAVAMGRPGFTGYLPMAPGTRTHFHYYSGFRPGDEYAFEIVGPVTGAAITAVTAEDLARIRVVPNPFLLVSRFQPSYEEPRVLFTNMPPAGTLRLYTVSGQFIQQVQWTPANLRGAGDLHVPLLTREGVPFASGLYIWVLTAPSDPSNPASAPVVVRGKLVVVR